MVLLLSLTALQTAKSPMPARVRTRSEGDLADDTVSRVPELPEACLVDVSVPKPLDLRRTRSEGGGRWCRSLDRKEATTDAAAGIASAAAERAEEASAAAPPAAAPCKRCAICLEDHPISALRVSGDLCGAAGCTETFCSSCLATYFKERVSSGRFSLPPMHCVAPICRRRLPTARWQPCVDTGTAGDYMQSAADLLTLRCPSCDMHRSLLQEAMSDPEDREAKIAHFVARCRDLAAVRRAWSRFAAGRARAEEFLEALRASGPDFKDAAPEQRLARDGGVYSEGEFRAWYGVARGQEEWDQAEVSEPAPVWELGTIFALIADVERRAALQAAQLRRNPRIVTPCCSAEYCFRCQVGSWHEGVSCEAFIAEETPLEVQFCPSCGVPTQRAEGCSSMVCLCGESWEWTEDDTAGDSEW